MDALDPRLQTFIQRCDAIGARLRLRRSTLSTKLFNDGKRLDEISSGRSDVGIGRLAVAEQALEALEGKPSLPKAGA